MPCFKVSKCDPLIFFILHETLDFMSISMQSFKKILMVPLAWGVNYGGDQSSGTIVSGKPGLARFGSIVDD